jgi:hypothetical protein
MSIAIKPEIKEELRFLEWYQLPEIVEFVQTFLNQFSGDAVWVSLAVKFFDNLEQLEPLLQTATYHKEPDWIENLPADEFLEWIASSALFNFDLIAESLAPLDDILRLDLADLDVLTPDKEFTLDGEEVYTLTPLAFLKEIKKVTKFIEVALSPLLTIRAKSEGQYLTWLAAVSRLDDDFRKNAEWLITATVKRSDIDFEQWALADFFALLAECMLVNYRFFGKSCGMTFARLMPQDNSPSTIGVAESNGSLAAVTDSIK